MLYMFVSLHFPTYFLSNLGVQYFHLDPSGGKLKPLHELENPPVDLAQKNSP